MPQVRTKGRAKSGKNVASEPGGDQRASLADPHELISRMLDYEAAAKALGIDLASGRFEMLTASERQYYRAELIADYIRLSAGNLGKTPGYFDATLDSFCSKICEMSIPSHELLGTYLAAVDVVTTEEELTKVPSLVEAVRRTIVLVLRACCDEMSKGTEPVKASA